MKARKVSSRPCIFLEDTREEIKNLSRREILNRTIGGVRTSVYGSNSDFTIFRTHYVAEVMGDKQFYKKVNEISLTFKNGKFFGNFTDELLIAIVKVFKLDWTEENWVRRLLAHNKILWAQIIQGKITNPEQLAKKYSKIYFKGVYSYKALKVYFESYSSIGSLWDIYYYTSNPNLWIEKYCALKWENDRQYEEHLNLARDILYYAKIENAKINSTWSYSRMASEHQKQIERDNLDQVNMYSDEKIATPFERDGLELILDERSCFFESQIMHNCVHSCYWRRVKRGEYLLVRGDIDGTHINLGIIPSYFEDEKLQIEQVHTIYNGSVSLEVREVCQEWIDRNSKELLEVLKEIRDSKKSLDYREENIVLPF